MYFKSIKNSPIYKAMSYPKGERSLHLMRTINDGDKVAPEQDLIQFYAAEQVLGHIEVKYQCAPIPPEVAEIAQRAVAMQTEVFLRMFSYLVLISIGESRHASVMKLQHHMTDDPNDKELFMGLHSRLSGKNRAGSRSEFLGSNRCLVKSMEYCLWSLKNGFGGGSYGGPKWVNIAKHPYKVLTGEITPVTMVDLAWTLVHNTGSIFNKNTIYLKDSGQKTLVKLLDLQRAGAISYAALNGFNSVSVKKFVTVEVSALIEDAKGIFGDGFVGQFTVADIVNAGALGSWGVNGEVKDDTAPHLSIGKYGISKGGRK